MIISITKDVDAIARILNHPEVYKRASDDLSPNPVVPMMKEPFFHLTEETHSAVIRIDPLNGITCLAHIASLPEFWGKGREFVTAAIKWGFLHTVFLKVVVIVPTFNRVTLRLVNDCGFEYEGRLRKSFLKNWKFYDQIVSGLTKEDFFKRKENLLWKQ